MKIVVGLGNPGKQYAETRHNVGWSVLDRIADRAGRPGRGRERDAAAVAQVHLDGLDLVLVKPLTYMNGSGLAVRKVLARERVKLSDLLVVVDDFALPLGRLRLRERGSAGGHNGLRSIIAEMGSQDFARLRVGIGEPSGTAVDHVLSRFATSERPLLDEVIEAAADAVEDWAGEGAARAASRWNAWTPTAADGAARSSPPPADAGVASAGGAGDGTAAADEAGPDAHGVVRTRTGWRKLLPQPRHEAER